MNNDNKIINGGSTFSSDFDTWLDIWDELSGNNKNLEDMIECKQNNVKDYIKLKYIYYEYNQKPFKVINLII
jgi:hypothetical protein